MGLKFKGEKSTKKKRSKLRSTDSSTARLGGSDALGTDDADADLSGWVDAPSESLLLGPSYLSLPETSVAPAVCLALQPTTGRVYPFVLPKVDPADASARAPATTSKLSAADLAQLDPEDLEHVVDLEASTSTAGRASSRRSRATLEPTDVYHVWVCVRIPDTNDKVTFRSGTNKFLASDQVGSVTADREARGPQEEWTLAPVTDRDGNRAYEVRNMYGKCLSVDVVAGGKVELRCDAEPTTTADGTAGAGDEAETERWRITMQGEFVAKAKKQYNERNGIKTIGDDPRMGASRGDGLTIVGDLSAQERASILKYQARGGGKYVGTEEDARDLRRAKKEGKLSEAMLDRRTKLKSDRYC